MHTLIGKTVVVGVLWIASAALTAGIMAWLKERNTGSGPFVFGSKSGGASGDAAGAPCCTLEDVYPPTDSLGE
jgi:hypothetical protein